MEALCNVYKDSIFFFQGIGMAWDTSDIGDNFHSGLIFIRVQEGFWMVKEWLG